MNPERCLVPGCKWDERGRAGGAGPSKCGGFPLPEPCLMEKLIQRDPMSPEEKVQARVDPARIPSWLVSGKRPRPFWLDPATQTIGFPNDSRVWTYVPVHDPAWWTP